MDTNEFLIFLKDHGVEVKDDMVRVGDVERVRKLRFRYEELLKAKKHGVPV